MRTIYLKTWFFFYMTASAYTWWQLIPRWYGKMRAHEHKEWSIEKKFFKEKNIYKRKILWDVLWKKNVVLKCGCIRSRRRQKSLSAYMRIYIYIYRIDGALTRFKSKYEYLRARLFFCLNIFFSTDYVACVSERPAWLHEIKVFHAILIIFIRF